jgi:hypothetical protein
VTVVRPAMIAEPVLDNAVDAAAVQV